LGVPVVLVRQTYSIEWWSLARTIATEKQTVVVVAEKQLARKW
jgi:hypothetical protein